MGRQLPPNSTNSVHSYLQMLLRTFAERCLTSRNSIKCDVLLHQQSWRSSNPNPAVEPKPTSLPLANLALERNSTFMDSHQPVRSPAWKSFISTKEPWDVSEATLERWRTEGIGPKYLKLCGRVLYRLVDIEEYESACLMSSTGKAVAV